MTTHADKIKTLSTDAQTIIAEHFKEQLCTIMTPSFGHDFSVFLDNRDGITVKVHSDWKGAGLTVSGGWDINCYAKGMGKVGSKTFRTRKDGTLNWSGILKAIEQINVLIGDYRTEMDARLSRNCENEGKRRDTIAKVAKELDCEAESWSLSFDYLLDGGDRVKQAKIDVGSAGAIHMKLDNLSFADLAELKTLLRSLR